MSEAVARRERRTARILLFDPEGRLLLFRYVTEGYDPFWIMAGGECDPGEDFAQAARRELREETGIDAQPKPLGYRRQADYIYDGEPVRATEHFFIHQAPVAAIDTSGHTELEQRVMQEHRWLTRDEIAAWPETIYPEGLPDLIDRALSRTKGFA